MSHNAPYLPPKILHNLCFLFLLGITAVPRKIENNCCANFFFLAGVCILGNVEVAYTHLLDATHRRLLSRLTRDERCCYLDICLQTWLTPFLFCVGRVRDHSGFDEHLLYCPWLVTRHISRLWRPRCGPLYQVRLERHFQTIPFSISIYYCVVACEYSRVRN